MSSSNKQEQNGLSGKHWVEDLFPPAFHYSLDRIMKSGPNIAETSLKQDEPSSEEGQTEDTPPEEVLSVFARAARGIISPLDTSLVKNVYERVWLMTHLQDQEQRRRELEHGSKEEEPFKVCICGAAQQRKDHRSVATSTVDIKTHCPPNIDDSCIWDSDEIEVLRDVFKSTKQQYSHIQAELQETKYQFEKFQQKHKVKIAELEEKNKKLQEVTKANHRLSILAKNLKKQVDEATSLISSLQTQLKTVKEQRTELLKEAHELRVIVDRERLDRKKVELELKHHNQEAIQEQRLQEEHLKHIYNEDIKFLQTTVEELTTQLKEEQTAHDKTKRGLEHLRRHFSSLSLEGEKGTNQGLVTEHQLNQFTY